MNNQFSKMGRFGDTELVHMRSDELRGLRTLANAVGTDLTINPQTGYPEAWKMPSWVLPVAAVAATALTAGAAAPAAAGALGAAGAGTAAAGGGLLAAEGAAAGAGAAGAAGGGLLGASGTQAGMLAAQEAGLGASSLGWGGATTGAQGMFNGALGSEAGAGVGGLLGNAQGYAKPAMQAMNAASQAQELAGPETPPPQGGLLQQPMATGPQGLQQLAGQNDQLNQQRQQQDYEQRKKRQEMIARMRGYA